MTETYDAGQQGVPPVSGGWGRRVISWGPSGWLNRAVAAKGTGFVALGCSTGFRALRVGIPNAGTLAFKIAKIAACPSSHWNDYVNPVGGGPWRYLTFAGEGTASDIIITGASAPTEVIAWPSAASALPGDGNAARWTWTDWTPMDAVSPDPVTGMHVVMLRWLNAVAGQELTFANGLFQHGWMGLPEVNRGFDYAMGGYNNGWDYVTDPARGNVEWELCRRNNLLNGSPLAIVQFLTDRDGIVGVVAGDSHQSGAGVAGSFNGFLAQFTTSFGRAYRGHTPFGFVNCAVGGIATQEIFAHLAALLPVVRPSFAVLPGWTYNAVRAGVQANAGFLEALFRAADLCRRNGTEPIFLTPFPRDQAAMTADILRGWQEARAAILRRGSEGALVVDGASLLCEGLNGTLTGTYRQGLSDDGMHPSDAGHALVANELGRVVEAVTGLRRPDASRRPPALGAQEPMATDQSQTGANKPMKTLLFCTSYAENQGAWNERWGRWLKTVVHSGLQADQILIVDDGSPVLPDWPGVSVLPAGSPRAGATNVAIHHFPDRRGQRVNNEPFPGWYRSFSHAVLYAIKAGFDKIIHIEADAFLITDRAIDFFNACDSGWVGLWCQRHGWPESTLQIMNKDQFAACEAFFSQPYSAHLGTPYRPPEQLIPFTAINRELVGDRYGEDGDIIPLNADYVSQVRWNMGPAYYWWLTPSGARRPQAEWSLQASPFVVRDQDARPGAPRIIALSMVKNEQDIVEPFVRHTALFVDNHVILDNASVDDTRRILTELMRELDGVVVTTLSAFGYRQSELMTRLLQACQTAYFADYVIFLDADEFISCKDRAEFERSLAAIPTGGYGYLPWRTFVITPFSSGHEQNDPPRSMPWRRAREVEKNKIVLRLDGQYWHDLEIAQGSHRAFSRTGRPVPSTRLNGVSLCHFPIRSAEQFAAKTIVGWMAYLAKDSQATQKDEGYHWRENFALVSKGVGISRETLCDLSMRYDHPPRQYDWSKDVVRDVPAYQYERRYSTGLYADPLALVARSWQASLEAQPPLLTLNRKAAATDTDDASKGDTAFDSRWHWENPFADIAPFRYISEKYRPQSVLDVGCGIGAYLKLFQNLGAAKIFGVDGIPSSATMLDQSEFQEADLSRPVALGRKFDIVMCLEVAEHLPYANAATLLEILSAHATGLIIFSAAEVGQPGHGHINCLPIERWLRFWQAVGWTPLLQETLTMRALSTLSWFRRNIVVLKQGIGDTGEEAIQTLQHIGSRPYAWHHTNPGIRPEVLGEALATQPFGYRSEA